MYKEGVTARKVCLFLSTAEDLVVKYLVSCLNKTTAKRFEDVEFGNDSSNDALSRFIVRSRENYAYELYLQLKDEGKDEAAIKRTMLDMLTPIYEEMYGTGTGLLNILFDKDIKEAKKWFGKLTEMREAKKCSGFSIYKIPDM